MVVFPNRLIVSGVIAVVWTALGSCGLFEPREPEAPIAAGSQFESPTSPSIVLRNLEEALLSANAADYIRCLSDTSKGLPPFRFTPSTQGLSIAPETFADWGIGQEQTYIRNLFADIQVGEVSAVSFSPSEVTVPPIGDSVQFTATYSVRFPHSRTDVEQQADGRLQFTFRQSRQNEWYITAWRDIVLDNQTSWSVLKARFHDR